MPKRRKGELTTPDLVLLSLLAERPMAPVLLERYGAAVTNQPSARGARAAVNNRRDFGTPSPGVAESK